jgi:hypothetical protein
MPKRKQKDERVPYHIHKFLQSTVESVILALPFLVSCVSLRRQTFQASQKTYLLCSHRVSQSSAPWSLSRPRRRGDPRPRSRLPRQVRREGPFCALLWGESSWCLVSFEPESLRLWCVLFRLRASLSLSPPCASLLNHEMKIDHQKKKKVKWETFANGKACQTSINK